ncbi:MAG: GNAT family N-acetyltransferase [Gemmatimonadota bacterium]|nr:GNAT family N-acetyltransferase [Gemmatimonadota bacterium]
MPDALLIRRATTADAASLAVLAEATFRDTFGEDNSAEDMDAFAGAHFSTAQIRDELADARGTTLLAESEGDLVGYAQLLTGAAVPRHVRSPATEIRRFYVKRSYRGTGLAHRLMKAAVTSAGERGSLAIWLGVWERNPRAIAFYGKFGFVDAGSHTFVLGKDVQTDRIMWRLVVIA